MQSTMKRRERKTGPPYVIFPIKLQGGHAFVEADDANDTSATHD
jgi:hypothetical protein